MAAVKFDRRRQVVQVGSSDLHWQLDKIAYASVNNTFQLKQVANNTPIKQTKRTLVSYSQHQISPKGYVTLPARSRTGS